MAIFEILNFLKPNLETLPEYIIFFDDYTKKFSAMTTEQLKEESDTFNYIHLSYTAKVARYRALKKELERRQKQ